jgi:phosphoribosyl-AMP cyclohydrolase
MAAPVHAGHATGAGRLTTRGIVRLVLHPIAPTPTPVMVEEPVSEQPDHPPEPHRPRRSVDVQELAEVGIEALQYDEAGLIPVVVQQHDSGEVLMVAWADVRGAATHPRAGRGGVLQPLPPEQWHKGATSGNTQRVVDVRVDCDADVLLYLVDQGEDGVACHTGHRTCFHRRLDQGPGVDRGTRRDRARP